MMRINLEKDLRFLLVGKFAVVNIVKFIYNFEKPTDTKRARGLIIIILKHECKWKEKKYTENLLFFFLWILSHPR